MVQTLDKFYTKNGEFSDLWVGEWVRKSKAEIFGVSTIKNTNHVAANITRFFNARQRWR